MSNYNDFNLFYIFIFDNGISFYILYYIGNYLLVNRFHRCSLESR